MPRSLRDPAGRRAILDRLSRLTPQHARTWGRMDPSQLLPHLASGLRFAVTAPDKLGAMHPSFGPMSARDWDVLQYRHFDHHLTQFSA